MRREQKREREGSRKANEKRATTRVGKEQNASEQGAKREQEGSENTSKKRATMQMRREQKREQDGSKNASERRAKMRARREQKSEQTRANTGHAVLQSTPKLPKIRRPDGQTDGRTDPLIGLVCST